MTSGTPQLPSLAIVAGGGAFPDLVADEARAGGTKVLAVRLSGHAEPLTLSSTDGIWARPEQLGHIFAYLRGQGVRDLVLIGRMRRPRIFSLRPDMTTLRLLPKILWPLCAGGDDALLRAVRKMLEGEGFRLHSAQCFITNFVADKGVMGLVAPDARASADIALGMEAARAHGARDVGQAVIVHDGVVIGCEAIDGTDALIDAHGMAGAVLVKMAKPQQDRALDLPSIGPDTIRRCAAKGFAGIAVEAGATLVANKKQVIDFANAYGLFLVGVT